MKKHVAYPTKLTAYFSWNVLKIYFIGLFSILLTIPLFYNFTLNNTDSLSFTSKIMYLFTEKAYLSIPFILTIIASIYIIYTKTLGYAISKTIQKLLHEKSDSIITPYLTKALEYIDTKNANLFQSKEQYINSKVEIKKEIQKLGSNKIIKIALAYLLQKINLDDVSFDNDNIPFKTVLQSKIVEKLHGLAQPSSRIIWLVVGLQWLFVIISYYLK